MVTLAPPPTTTMDNFEDFAKNQLGFLTSAARGLLRGRGASHTTQALVQAGLVGLWQAHQRRDTCRSEAFENYARARARGAMVDELRATGPRKRGAQAALKNDSWSSDTPWAILQECSLDEVDGASDQADPEEDCFRSEVGELVRKLVWRLPARHRQVVRRHYFEGACLSDVGAELGVTQARASQLVGESLLLMRDALTRAEISGLLGDGETAPPKKIMGGRGQGRARSWSHGGKSQSLSAWARELGVSVGSLQGRIAKGWSLAETLETPVGPGRRGGSVRPTSGS